MKKVETKSAEEFNKITRAELHQLWFVKALTDKQIANMYGIDKKAVKEKRKELSITWLNSGLLYVAGGDKYRAPKKTKK